MSNKNRNVKLEKFVRLTSSLTRMRRLQIETLSRKYDTPDMRRLSVKLKSPEVQRLYEEGMILIEEEGLDSQAFWVIDLEEVKFDLGKETFMLSYEDIKLSTEDVDPNFLRSISFALLDWTWDFSWSYSMWDEKKFNEKSLRMYGVIRGQRPKSLHDRPYQIVLNAERKRRVKLWKQRIARAMISGKKDRVEELLREPEALFVVKAKELV